MRQAWTGLTDAERLAQCAVDTYRASGPGGQKRNKTSSAVRLRHLPSGLIVIAEESRSQHENKAKALTRLYRALFLELREPLPASPEDVLAHPDYAPARSADGRVHIGPKDPRFWPLAGILLDSLAESAGQVSTAAERLALTTAHFTDTLQLHPRLWQEANRLRMLAGLKPLR
ncbi:MAG: peptide chain release factor family protein [Gemmataceae bacterium]